jgi:F0F1-type ATP synthase epsilon subunit
MIFNDTISVFTDESLNIDEADLSEIKEAEERAQKALEDARSKREVETLPKLQNSTQRLSTK